jgi:hypothetical protein
MYVTFLCQDFFISRVENIANRRIRGSGQYGVSTGKVQYEGRRPKKGGFDLGKAGASRSGGQQAWIRYFLLSVGRSTG